MDTLLKGVLARSGISGIYASVDTAVVELINEFDHSPDKYSLASTVLAIYGQDHFLRDKSNRRRLLEHLDKAMALKLCDHLGLSLNSGKSPWDSINAVKFGKNEFALLYEFFGISIKDKTETIELIDSPSTDTVAPNYSLFDHQNRAAFEVKKIINSDSGRVLLHMPTGSGKTRTTMSIISDTFREFSGSGVLPLILWLADTEELCDQATKEFEKAWSALGSEEVPVYKFYGQYEQSLDHIDGGFIVAGVSKINHRLTKSQTEIFKFGSKVHLVIFDEAHKVVAPTYENLIEIIQAIGGAKLIGLSATPGRATLDKEKNEKFVEFFNKEKVSLSVQGYDNPIDFLQDEGYLANIVNTKLPYYSEDLSLTNQQITYMVSGGDVPQKVLDKLGDDTKRNIIIVNTIIERVESGDFIIVFACSVAHAKAIAALLRYKQISAGLVTGATPSLERKQVIEKYKQKQINVLINYGVLTTGFDAPNTNVALIARPTTSLMLYSQMVGRAIRGKRAGGNETAHIFTIVDSEIPGFEDLSEAFNHWNDSWN